MNPSVKPVAATADEIPLAAVTIRQATLDRNPDRTDSGYFLLGGRF
jgi:hypothetical protein